MATSKVLELRAEWIRLYKKATVNDKGRKWYPADLAQFIKDVGQCTDIERMETAVKRLKWQVSEESERFHDKEIKRMDRAGMFNVKNLGPRHALD